MMKLEIEMFLPDDQLHTYTFIDVIDLFVTEISEKLKILEVHHSNGHIFVFNMDSVIYFNYSC